MIKAFLFDWGGVMSDGGRGNELGVRLAQNLGISDAAATDLIGLVWYDYSCGKITETELWARIEKTYGAPISAEQRKIWNIWTLTAIIPEMKKLVTRLREDGYRVGLVSNTITNTAEEIRSHGGYDIFEFAILSYEVGVAKPDNAIYELALKRLPGIDPSEVVFIDDQERCLVPARAIGMKTVLSENTAQVLKDIAELVTISTK